MDRLISTLFREEPKRFTILDTEFHCICMDIFAGS
jgi:hypothetical protein